MKEIRVEDFYNAIIKEKEVKNLVDDKSLRDIAKEMKKVLVDEEYIRFYLRRESTIAKMRTLIKKCLKKYNFPTDYILTVVKNVSEFFVSFYYLEQEE